MDELIDYQPTVLGKAPTRMLTTTLPHGAELFVGLQYPHPQTGDPAVKHEFRNPQPEGEKTVLRFSLTLDAVRALTQIYVAHGIIPGVPRWVPSGEGMPEDG